MNEEMKLESDVSDQLLNTAYDYYRNYDEWTTSDFQAHCEAMAKHIIKLVKESEA